MANKKKEKEDNTESDSKIVINEVKSVETVIEVSQEVLDLKKQIEDLKAAASQKEELELELKALKDQANRKGGKKIVLEMATYKFRQILDRSVSFSGTHGHPITEGGRNRYTRYCCEDGAEVELPVIYANELNMCEYPEPKWTTDESGNAVKSSNVNLRWIFTKV